MRVPLEWLREYCDPQLDTAGVASRLTMTGTKVEALHRVGVGDVTEFVIGRVLSAEKHPDADRLTVCEVDVVVIAGQPVVVKRHLGISRHRHFQPRPVVGGDGLALGLVIAS